jgi:hypothetical protein
LSDEAGQGVQPDGGVAAPVGGAEPGEVIDRTDCVESPPETGGRDLAEVALADPPLPPPGTIRPQPGPKNVYYFFRIIPLSCGAPLRNRTVDLLLTMDTQIDPDQEDLDEEDI